MVSRYSLEFKNIDDFIAEWGSPDTNNIPLSISQMGEDIYIDIAQSRKDQFASVTIKSSTIDQLPYTWIKSCANQEELE